MAGSEGDTLSYMVRAAAYIETTARRLLDMPWIADDISDNEAKFIETIYVMNGLWGYPALSERLLDVEWIVDGVSYDDQSAAEQLLYISRESGEEGLAVRLIDMPFLQTSELSDILALMSLKSMASMDALSDFLARPQFKGGITDDQTIVVAMLSSVLEHAPHRVDALLDPSAATVERRMVELPLSGEVELAVVRPYRGGTRRSMDLLENAVREAEKLMDAPLPFSRDAVWALFVHDNGGAAGSHLGTHITILTEYDSDDASFAPHVIAHEVAHYYWHANPDWLDEGMAELMAAVIESERTGSPVRARNAPCGVVENIRALEVLAPEEGEPAHRCNYSLGEGLFLDLLRRLGEDAFWEGIRKLYAEKRRYDTGIEDVRQAFGPDAAGIISRWYGE